MQIERQTGPRPIIVVGGGLGGIASALALGRQGHPVRLLEQSAEIAPIGYGVQIGPNVLPVLARLGLEQEVRRAAYLPDELLLHDAYSGAQLFSIPLKGAAFESRYEAPYIAIHRVDLHEILLRACRALSNVDLNQATTVTGYTQSADAVQVSTASGATIEGQALIAADGLRSRLRAQLHPQDTAHGIGYSAYRTIIKAEDAPLRLRNRRGVTMWTGADFHVIYYPLRDATEINIVGVFQAPSGADTGDEEAHRQQVARAIVQAQPEVHDVVSVLNLARRWAIADRNPDRKWGEGRMTLLGDSAHATLQSLAQGAGMALEDAVALAGQMGRHQDDPAQAFAAFQRQRFLRTARVVLESRALWQRYHCSGTEAEIRAQQWQESGAEDYYRCLDWLWKPPRELID